MLMRFDPFQEFDRALRTFDDTSDRGRRSRSFPMDAVAREGRVEVTFDLPGLEPDAIDLEVERNVLTVTAERVRSEVDGEQVIIAERPFGRMQRQLYLGDNLDGAAVEASYRNGVLHVSIPVAEQAKARKVAVAVGSDAIEGSAELASEA